MSTSTLHLGIFYMPQIYDMGPTALLPLRRKACWGFFSPLKALHIYNIMKRPVYIWHYETPCIYIYIYKISFCDETAAPQPRFGCASANAAWYLMAVHSMPICLRLEMEIRTCSSEIGFVWSHFSLLTGRPGRFDMQNKSAVPLQ